MIFSGGFRRFEECFPHLCHCGEGVELDNAMFTLANLQIADHIPSIIYDDPNNNNSVSEPVIKEKIETSKDLIFRPDRAGPIKILPNLYLGNKKDSSVLKSLKNVNISK